MSKRVQRLRHAVTEADLFTGRVGEITVETTNLELRVHDGTTAGGHATARKDLANVQTATAERDGKMTAAQVTELTTATADIATNAADIATNAAAIVTNAAAIALRGVPSGTLTSGHALIGNGSLSFKSAGFTLEQQLPTGVKALFCQAAAPTLWTKDVDVNDVVLRMVSGTGAGTGGSWTISGVSVDGHALTKGEIPAHVHVQSNAGSRSDLVGGGSTSAATSGAANTGDGQADGLGTGGAGAASAHTHSLTIGSSWRPAYVDVIKCTKDAPVSLA